MTLLNIEDLIATKADKGGATVIWGIDEYLKEANDQLHNKELYYEHPRDHIYTLSELTNLLI